MTNSLSSFPNFRMLSLGGFLACTLGMGFALYLEHFQGLEPCPMCVFQRVAMIAAGLVFLAGALHGPKATGRWVYSVLATVTAGAGAGIAARHVWLQGLPPDQVPACGPGLNYLLESFPFMEVLSLVLKGDGNCAKIDAAWLGISLPSWTMLAFIGLTVYALAMPLLARRVSPTPGS